MTDDSHLRSQVRAAITAGELPSRLPDRVWGGSATAAACAVCREPMGGSVEFELVFSDANGTVEATRNMHPHCLKAFEVEVAALAPRQAAARNPGGPPSDVLACPDGT
jgi:hypothetical protein